MADRSQTVQSAVALLFHVGGIDLSAAHVNMASYIGDMRTERRAAYARKNYERVEQIQADIAKAQEVIDALELVMLEA